MSDVIGSFDEMEQARASIQEIVGGHLVLRQSIELVGPDRGKELRFSGTTHDSLAAALLIFSLANRSWNSQHDARTWSHSPTPARVFVSCCIPKGCRQRTREGRKGEAG